ncbi:DUF3592 domain-containing protein [Fodinibius halophilus]|uniref:DUF3592 domain-containing protein n=1 Tax=Fodinibius halophilus TaxID=1736908 RepID=A0A6M1T702_9BACT|nr:DUF3592 domain-containing protein [Fodinibius halophilus]NGP88423.1 DUF3592 domain-containing protein [Fodinibius halophilus]
MNTFKTIFGIVGLVFCGFGINWGIETSNFLDKAISTQGTVTDMVVRRSSDSRTYSPAIQFADSRGNSYEFVSNTSSSSPSYSRGENVDILYLPSDPQEAEIDSFFSLWGGPIIFGGLGFIFFAIGGGLIIYPIIKKRKDEHLKKTGTPVQAEFQRVDLNTSLQVNGSHPYRVISQWQNPANSEIHVFKSNNIWFDPTEYIDRERITVFMSSEDPDDYYVDLSFLPEMAD